MAGHALRIQASGGAVLSRVRDTDVDAMIVKADLALYKAKELGKNDWRLFESAMDAAFRNRQLMKADLRTAIEAKALRVVYQPIVAMETMRIASCEALCRWDHPDLGPISPSIFIPLAEEMGIISEISTFVLQAACAECARWPEQISVSVNLSAKDFRNRDVVDKVREALAPSGLAPHRLEIEVTETALLDDKSLTRQYIEELKLLGVRIALDDFGTGYSSLSYLHKLPLDKIKIDRSFLVDVSAEYAFARTAEGHRQSVAAARPDRHGRGRRNLRAAQDSGASGEARSGAGLPVRLGAVGVRHRDDVEHGLAFAKDIRSARRAAKRRPARGPVRLEAGLSLAQFRCGLL